MTVAAHGSSNAVVTASSSVMLVLVQPTPLLRISCSGEIRSRMRMALGSSPRARRCETIQAPTRPVVWSVSGLICEARCMYTYQFRLQSHIAEIV